MRRESHVVVDVLKLGYKGRSTAMFSLPKI
jgi:hypothetical protein